MHYPDRKKTPSKKQYQQKLGTLSSKVACLEQELKGAYLKIAKLEQEDNKETTSR